MWGISLWKKYNFLQWSCFASSSVRTSPICYKSITMFVWPWPFYCTEVRGCGSHICSTATDFYFTYSLAWLYWFLCISQYKQAQFSTKWGYTTEFVGACFCSIARAWLYTRAPIQILLVPCQLAGDTLMQPTCLHHLMSFSSPSMGLPSNNLACISLSGIANFPLFYCASIAWVLHKKPSPINGHFSSNEATLHVKIICWTVWCGGLCGARPTLPCTHWPWSLVFSKETPWLHKQIWAQFCWGNGDYKCSSVAKQAVYAPLIPLRTSEGTNSRNDLVPGWLDSPSPAAGHQAKAFLCLNLNVTPSKPNVLDARKVTTALRNCVGHPMWYWGLHIWYVYGYMCALIWEWE